MKKVKIAIVLPYGEHFSPKHSGAIGLCRKEYLQHSQYAKQIKVLGGLSEKGHHGVDYAKVAFKPRWFEGKTRAYSKAILKAVTARKADIIEINNRPLMVRYLAKRTDKKLVLYLHNDPVWMKGAKTVRQRKWLIKHCAAIFCVSEYIKKRFLSGIHSEADNVQIAYPGIHLPVLKQEHKENVFLYSGRMIEEKGALAFANALCMVLPELPDWRGTMIGLTERDSGTAYEQQISAAMSTLGNRGDYLAFASHETVMDLFAKAHIAVVPSVWEEPFGRTAVEALASGCALICSNRGGLSEIAQASAVTCEVDAAALAAQMLTLANDVELRQTYQHKAIRRSKAFSIAHSAAQIDEYYQQILASS